MVVREFEQQKQSSQHTFPYYTCDIKLTTFHSLADFIHIASQDSEADVFSMLVTLGQVKIAEKSR